MTYKEALEMTEDFIYMCEKCVEKSSGSYKEYWERKLAYYTIAEELLKEELAKESTTHKLKTCGLE